MFCPKCGKQLKDGSKFCSGCGAQLAAREYKTVVPKPITETSETPAHQEPPADEIKVENNRIESEEPAVKKRSAKTKKRTKKPKQPKQKKKSSGKKTILLIIPLVCALVLCGFGVSKLISKDGKSGFNILKTVSDRKNQKYLGTWESLYDNKKLIFFSNGQCVYRGEEVLEWKVEKGSLILNSTNMDFGKTEMNNDVLSVMIDGSVSSFKKSYPVGKEKYTDSGNFRYNYTYRYIGNGWHVNEYSYPLEFSSDDKFWVCVYSNSGGGSFFVLTDSEEQFYDIEKTGADYIYFDRWIRNSSYDLNLLTDFKGNKLIDTVCDANEMLLGVFEENGEIYFWIKKSEDAYNSHESILKVVSESTGEIKAQWSENEMKNKYDTTYIEFDRLQERIKQIGNGQYLANDYSGNVFLFDINNGRELYHFAGSKDLEVKNDDQYIYLQDKSRSRKFVVFDREFQYVTDNTQIEQILNEEIIVADILKNGLIRIKHENTDVVCDLSGKIQYDCKTAFEGLQDIYEYQNEHAVVKMYNSASVGFFTVIDTDGRMLFEPIKHELINEEKDKRERFKYKIETKEYGTVLMDSDGNYVEYDKDVQTYVFDGNKVYSLKIIDGDMVKQEVTVHSFLK